MTQAPMPTAAAAVALVQAFWAAYQSRDWAGARRLLSDEAHCTWWTTQERFIGADAVVNVNAMYPEGWTIHLLALEVLAAGRALSLVRVDHGQASHYAHSWFAFTTPQPDEALKIAAIEEFWAGGEPPPAWREGLSGRERTGAVCNRWPLRSTGPG